ncbi:hypothetical protein DV451_002027 [Geotrichum candidum]|uniref:Uncharacterized protein n=1 Tax=Geotrichum candidum TaxID=1173061 RepID=A0A9P5G5H5_GEOCN|nr:hypothetical protein DV451_002027 [Geotrichum candidum]KAF5109693.1 hypothetical protein DV453_001299 [Geotrichum candidum]
MISSLDNLSPEKLRQELDFEQSENQILSRQLNDTKMKLSSALNVQSQLELDLVDMTKQVAILQGQVKDLKKSKNQLENELSKEQMNYINEKQQWLDKEAKTEAIVENLRSDLSKANAANPSTPSTPSSFSFPGTFSSASTATTAATSTTSSTSSGGFGHRRLLSITSLSSSRSNNNSNSSDSKAIEKLKSELEQARQQADFVSKEYTARFDQIETELQQSKTQVARLIEENEGFQFLLVEKAILSGLDEETEETEETEQLSEEDKKSLEAEVKITKSHNKALTTSLERLIQRLLESKDFERTLEENTMSGNINATTLSAFSSRVLANNNQSSSTNSSSRPAFNRGHHSGRGSVSSMFSISSGLRRNPSVWTSVILGAGATGAADDHHSVSDGTATTDSVNSSRPNSPIANGVMSSDSSISSIDTTTLVNSPTATSGNASQLNALLNGSVARRPSTISQKKLRPLTMAN